MPRLGAPRHPRGGGGRRACLARLLSGHRAAASLRPGSPVVAQPLLALGGDPPARTGLPAAAPPGLGGGGSLRPTACQASPTWLSFPPLGSPFRSALLHRVPPLPRSRLLGSPLCRCPHCSVPFSPVSPQLPSPRDPLQMCPLRGCPLRVPPLPVSPLLGSLSRGLPAPRCPGPPPGARAGGHSPRGRPALRGRLSRAAPGCASAAGGAERGAPAPAPRVSFDHIRRRASPRRRRAGSARWHPAWRAGTAAPRTLVAALPPQAKALADPHSLFALAFSFLPSGSLAHGGDRDLRPRRRLTGASVGQGSRAASAAFQDRPWREGRQGTDHAPTLRR